MEAKITTAVFDKHLEDHLDAKNPVAAADITCSPINESYMKVTCTNAGACQELADRLTFEVANVKFSPLVRQRRWDGKVRLFNQRSKRVYRGLLSTVEEFARQNNYTFDNQIPHSSEKCFSIEEAKDFIRAIKLPFEPRDYQLNAFVQAVRNKRCVIVSPTASGKSLIAYMLTLWWLKMNIVVKSASRALKAEYTMELAQDLKAVHGLDAETELANILSAAAIKPSPLNLSGSSLHLSGYMPGRVLIIVPTISLVHQMAKDFEEYGLAAGSVHMVSEGTRLNDNSPITIATWQSLILHDPSELARYDFVIGDEAHNFKAKSLCTIMESMAKTRRRVAMTGTLDGAEVNELTIQGLFGKIINIVSTKELMDRGDIAKLNIKVLALKYHPDSCKKLYRCTYEDEIKYLNSNRKRNNFIKNLALSLKGNTLILYSRVEKHGEILYDLLRFRHPKTFFVHGGIPAEEREFVREMVAKHDDVKIVASYGTFSTGINMPRLHNTIFASPNKSRIRVMQSIGRGIRNGEGKTTSNLFDIADDLQWKGRKNYTLNHMIERIKMYSAEQFSYDLHSIELGEDVNADPLFEDD